MRQQQEQLRPKTESEISLDPTELRRSARARRAPRTFDPNGPPPPPEPQSKFKSFCFFSYGY